MEASRTAKHEALRHLCELMDRLEPRCAFDKWDVQRTPAERRAYQMHQRLLSEAGRLEVELGL